MSPRTATQNSTITLRGTLANHTGSAVSGVTVQARPARRCSTPGRGWPASPTARPIASTRPSSRRWTPTRRSHSVPNGATVTWAVSFDASHSTTTSACSPSGSRPLTADGAASVTARTFMPFWPSDKMQQPAGLQVAWIWPLIDTPQQGACSNTLATSELAGVGRLGRAAFHAARRRRHLGAERRPDLEHRPGTAVRRVGDDQRLLHRGGADCTGRSAEKPSKDGRGLARQAAADHRGAARLPHLLRQRGRRRRSAMPGSTRTSGPPTRWEGPWPARYLPNTFGKNGEGTGDGAVLRAAWPADGLADRGVLTSLADDGGYQHPCAGERRGRARPSAGRLRRRAQPDDERHREVGVPCCSPTRG